MTDITFCLMTCGEETEQDCLEAFRSQPGHDQVTFDEVRGVTPAAAALNVMIARCGTEYLVPLDSDMVLYPRALDRILVTVEVSRKDRGWHSILFPLWDTLTQEKIMALKVFRSRVVKRIPYKDLPCPDIAHYEDLKAAGYHTVDCMDEDPIGDHVVRGGFFCYAKFRDLYRTTRVYPEVVLESHFKDGDDLLSRARNHFDFFCRMHEQTGNDDYLHCIAGMVDGMTSPLTGKSKDLSDLEMKVPVSEAKNAFVKIAGRKKKRFV